MVGGTKGRCQSTPMVGITKLLLPGHVTEIVLYLFKTPPRHTLQGTVREYVLRSKGRTI